MLGEETPELFSSFRDMIKEEISNSLKNLQPAVSGSDPKGMGAQQESCSENEEPVASIEPNSSSSSDDESESEATFRVEDIDSLLKAVRATMQLEDPKIEKTVEDRMFEGLGEKKKRTFPVHKNIKSLIQREWKYPDKKVYIPKGQKRKYPFSEEDTSTWDKAPKLDGAIARIFKKSSLPFDDGCSLQDPLDKRIDTSLRRSWEASTSTFKPNVASACVARSLLVWLSQLEDSIQDKTPRETILASLPMLKKATAFLADASTDAIKLSAKSAVLSNSARRALWLKSWGGDMGSKSKLCTIPCEGQYLFGSVLSELLEKASNKASLFPPIRSNKQQFFRPSEKASKFRKPRQDSYRARGGRRSKGFLFN